MGKSVVMSVQHASRVIPLTIEGADGSPEIVEGNLHASVVDTAQGVYTVTFTNAFARVPVIIATVEVASTGVSFFSVIHTVTATGFVCEVTDDAGALQDAKVHLLVFGFDSADEG